MLQDFIEINSRKIGPGRPVYVIAEVSANHNQDFEQAVKLIQVARDSGADAVKLQTYTADTLTIQCNQPCFRVSGGTLWDGRTLHDLYQEAYTPWDWQPRLKAVADDLGLDLFSTPFDFTAVDFLEGMGVAAYKIASFEMVDLPLIRRVTQTGKPIIMSTGMASAAEIEEAVETVRSAGGTQLALLKCTSAYPSAPEDMNLRTIPDLATRFGVPVGLSDHTMGLEVPTTAVALGACIIEKHFTLSRSTPGPDSAFSLEPDELKAMITAIRIAERSLGQPSYGPGPREQASLAFRRSLFVVEDMKAGELFTAQNLRSIRPGHGLHTRHLGQFLGQPAACDIQRGTPLAWEHAKSLSAGSGE
jgi:N-acetylneuraminate synthase